MKGPSGWLFTGASLAAFGVMLGAFGAHGLRGRVSPELLATFETGARYHLIHALALLAVAWASERFSAGLTSFAGWAFVAGILLFSGSLYAMTVTGARWLGAVTPLGGLAFIVGWFALALAAWRG